MADSGSDLPLASLHAIMRTRGPSVEAFSHPPTGERSPLISIPMAIRN